MRYSMIFFLLFTPHSIVFGQGGIDHIKNQPYMKYASGVNCVDTPMDGSSDRICANLAYQKSDSLLVVIYNKLLNQEEESESPEDIIKLQEDWRAFRDKHCGFVWKKYQGGSAQATTYLKCLTELTENRIKELISLLEE